MTSVPSTISGITYSQARKLANAEFEDDMIKIVQNITEMSYDVYLKEPIDKKKVDKFKKTWNNAFRILPTKVGDPIK